MTLYIFRALLPGISQPAIQSSIQLVSQQRLCACQCGTKHENKLTFHWNGKEIIMKCLKSKKEYKS